MKNQYFDGIAFSVKRFVSYVKIQIFHALRQSSHRLIAHLGRFFDGDRRRDYHLRLFVRGETQFRVPESWQKQKSDNNVTFGPTDERSPAAVRTQYQRR